jgi:DNA-binding NarL/FixJ family response regulator
MTEASTQPIKLLIVDDQEIVRNGLSLILGAIPEFAIVGQANDGDTAEKAAAELRPDVVLMDIKMPRRSGIQATRAIRSALPETRVILLTTYDVDDWVFEGIRAGANGYLLKDTSMDQLSDVIRAVHQGESVLDATLAGRVMDEFRRISGASDAPASAPPPRSEQPHAPTQPDDPMIEPLSEREHEVLQLIAQGLTNKDIAAKLFLSEGTVRNYVSSVLGKLHAHDRTQAVIKAAQRRMVRLD